MSEEDKRKPWAGDYYNLGLYWMYKDPPNWDIALKYFNLAVEDSEANNKFGVPSRYYEKRGVARIARAKQLEHYIEKNNGKYRSQEEIDHEILKIKMIEGLKIEGHKDLQKARELQEEKRKYKIETLRDFLICRDEEHDTIMTDDDYDSLDLCDDILRAKPEDVKTLALKIRLLARDGYSHHSYENLERLVVQLEYLVKINRKRLQRLLEKQKDWVYKHKDLSKDLDAIKIEEDNNG